MTRIGLSAVLATVTLCGCAAWERNAVGDLETMLAAAGFTVLPATTPDRRDTLTRLPPNQLVQQIVGEQVSYLYPDPILCHCLYVGGQAEYGRFQYLALQRRIASDQVTAAQLNSDMRWGWGPWGGYGFGFY